MMALAMLNEPEPEIAQLGQLGTNIDEPNIAMDTTYVCICIHGIAVAFAFAWLCWNG